MVDIVLSVEVDAPAEAVWAGAVDWEHQGEWMLGTRVWPVVQDGAGVGGRTAAFTGVGPLGFLDTMQITGWEPPHRIGVLHDGWLVRGPAAMEVEPLGDGRSRFTLREHLELPLGRLGELGFRVVGPVFVAGLRLSLRRFARWVERRHRTGVTGPARASRAA